MYTIKIEHRNIGPTIYKVYSKREADKKEVMYEHWTKARQGEYAISDDNIVAKVIKRKNYDDKTRKSSNTYIRFPWGYHFFNEPNQSKTLTARGRKSYYKMAGKP